MASKGAAPSASAASFEARLWRALQDGDFCALIQRLDLDDRRAVVAADPERPRISPVIHKHAADISRARQLIFDVLAGLDVEARDAIGVHRAGPGVPIAVERRIVRR